MIGAEPNDDQVPALDLLDHVAVTPDAEAFTGPAAQDKVRVVRGSRHSQLPPWFAKSPFVRLAASRCCGNHLAGGLGRLVRARALVLTRFALVVARTLSVGVALDGTITVLTFRPLSFFRTGTARSPGC
jgi:hypothetical protein